ncbi:MAG: Anaerobic ribonucleoside-triphosphate reductase activating protein [Patescibacteria group bacterium]|nr:Anaerobic ribonucleoside-triphosphate reductase activating protein [Patescibacteria group bacterium]
MVFGGFEKCTLIDYPGKVACMVYTIGCNFRCPYCHNPELVDETVEVKITEDQVFDFLDERTKMLDGIVITGGEPTMHGNELIKFMKKVKEKGFLVKLDSNGTNPSVLKEAIDLKIIDYIAMDIKSPLSKYTQTVARPVDVAAIRESIALIMKSAVEYEFRTTVIKAQLSLQDFDEIGQEIKGAKKYFLQKFIPNKLLNPQFRKKATYSDEEFLLLQEKMNNYVKYCGVR